MDKVFLKIGYNTSIQIFGKVLSILLSVVTVGLLTRYLGASGYGNFTLVFTYMSFFAVLSDFGLQLTMVRELTGKSERLEMLFGTYFWLKIALVICSTILAFIFLFFFPYPDMLKVGILIGGLAVGVSGLIGYGSTIFQSDIRLDLVTLVDVITKISTVTLIILFIFLKFDFFSIIASVLVGNLIGLMSTIFLLKRNIHFSFNFDKSLAKKIFLISLPIGFTSFFSLIYFKMDTIILSVMKNTAEVGVYSLAYKVLENVIVIWGFYMASVYPLLARFSAAGEKSKFNKLSRNSFSVAMLLAFLIVLPVFVFAPFIINVFAGKGFTESVTSLRIIIFALPLVFINNIFYYRFLIKRNMRPVIFALIGALVLNFGLNLAYVPKYGYLASSFVTVITEFFLFAMLTTIIILQNYRRKL